MPRSEDYLDSLLDSINGNPTKEDSGPKPTEAEGLEESSFLADFERDLELEMEESGDFDIVKDFEKELGITPDKEEDVLSDIEEDDAKAPVEASAPEPSVSADEGDDLMAGLNGILNGDEESSVPGEAEQAAPSAEPGESPAAAEASAASEPEAPAVPEAPEAPEDDEFMSDIEGDEVPAAPETPEVPEEAAADASPEGEASTEITQEEVVNIGDLLDSIDEEGNINLPEEGQANLVEEGNTSAEDSKDSEKKEESSDGEEKKQEKLPPLQMILSKVTGFIAGLKKASKDIEEQERLAEMGLPLPGEEEETEEEGMSPEEKKAAKKEEKEKKKKEKEEAKKKAAAEKDAKKKAEKTKEKKPKKKKEPDRSPVIPIIFIAPFIVLALSLCVLWYVAQDSFGYNRIVNTAKANFDHEQYLEGYRQISDMELKEDDAILASRAKLMATLELRHKSYLNYAEREDHIYAIDQLVRGVVFYNHNSREASDLGIPSEYRTLGIKLVEELSSKYNVSEDDAEDLIEIPDRKEYTKALYRILEEQGYWGYPD